MGLSDIASFSVENTVVDVTDATASIVISAERAVGITVTTASVVGPVLTEIVTGPQGPPGLQNVFVQTTPPSNPNLNDIWIEI